jgi:hypothetical protein
MLSEVGLSKGQSDAAEASLPVSQRREEGDIDLQSAATAAAKRRKNAAHGASRG